MSVDTRIIDALEVSEIDYDREGYDPVRSFSDNGIDSLDVMSLLLAIEEKYMVKFSESEADAIHTPNDISVFLDKKIA